MSLKDVAVVNRPKSTTEWVLLAPIPFSWGDNTITVPRSFVTDFASIPWPFTLVVAKWGRHGRAAILHDWLYAKGEGPDGPGKWQADWLMLRFMLSHDWTLLRNPSGKGFWFRLKKLVWPLRFAVSVPIRLLIWLVLSTFGWIVWIAKRARNEDWQESKCDRQPVKTTADAAHIVLAIDADTLDDLPLSEAMEKARTAANEALGGDDRFATVCPNCGKIHNGQNQ